MARDIQTGVFDSCLAALPMQKPKTEQIPAECASADEQCHHAFSTSSRGRAPVSTARAVPSHLIQRKTDLSVILSVCVRVSFSTFEPPER